MTKAPEDTQSGLQVLVTTGRDDPERALLGLKVALVAASAGAETTVFFTQGGAQWACANIGHDAQADEVTAALGALIESGAQLECCSVCIEQFCLDGGTGPGLRADVRVAGLVSLVQRTVSGIPTVTF